MEDDILAFLFNVFLFFGAVIAFVNKGQISKLMQTNARLDKIINFQAAQIEKLKKTIQDLSSDPQKNHLANSQNQSQTKADLINNLKADIATKEIEDKAPVDAQVVTQDAEQITSAHAASGIKSSDVSTTSSTVNPWQAQTDTQGSKQTKDPKPANKSLNIDDLLKGNVLLWLGAIILGLGGIFLAKYSIEAGLLPPIVRVISGGLFGIGLVVGAEYLNRNKERFNINTPTVSAALASGGVITCFAMALISFNFYHFISFNVAFALLAIIALGATYLALRFGPLLAAVGIVGAYAVPALITRDTGSVLGLLLYVAFISLSAVWVTQTVKKTWLWWLSFVGHIMWLMVAMVMSEWDNFISILSFVVFTIYLFVLTDLLGWKLQNLTLVPFSLKQLLMPRKEHVAVLIPVLSILFFAVHYPLNYNFFFVNLIIATVLCFSATRHSALDTWPFLALAVALISFSSMPMNVNFDDNLFPFNGAYLFIQIAALVGILFSAYMIKRFADRVSYLLLLVVTPLSLFGVSYVLSADQAATYLYPVWATELLLVGAVSSYFSTKTTVAIQKVTFLILANTMLTLCFTMLLEASALTLVLAVQVASMSYLSWKYKVTIPDWLYKAGLIVIVSRLTFAPWLAEYKDELIFNVHWTLIVYPLILAIIWFASKYNPSKPLKVWLSGVSLHVVALLVTTETSYQLIGDYPDFTSLTFKESILLAFNWLALAGVYLWRSHLSTTKTMTKLYQLAAIILVSANVFIHLDISLINNPFFETQLTGNGIFNWLILMWAIPALILYSFIHFKLIPETLYKAAFISIGVLLFLLINGEIRSVFNEGRLLWLSPIQQTELYAYSIVWLAIATGAIFFAQHKASIQIRNLGFGCLALVILKVFIVDMSSLHGLYRAISFIGLGLCLVGIGWLFQKLQFTKDQTDSVSDKIHD